MPAVRTVPGTASSPPGASTTCPPGPGTPVPSAGATAFLPLTLSAIATATADGRRGLGQLADRAWAAERDAQASWQALLGGCSCARRRSLPGELRRLSDSVGGYARASWWDGPGRAHRNRVAAFERWVVEALAEGDGAEFAEACAGYDEATARALLSAPPSQ